jgi:MFS family permease
VPRLPGPRRPGTRRGPWLRGPLSEPALARLWLAGLVSETGDWLLLVALPVYVLQLTGSSLVTATVFLLGLLPGLVVGPVAGVLVDRWERRRTLVVVSVAQALLLLPLLAVHGRAGLPIVYAVTAAEAGLGHLFQPAKNALVPSLVAPAQLVAANGLIGLTENLARLAGGPLGGVLVELTGLRGIVVADAASFLLAAALLAPGRRAPAQSAVDEPAADGLLEQWRAGLTVIRGDHRQRAALAVTAVAAVAQGIFVVLFVVFVVRVLHGGGAEVGLLRGIQAVGAIAAGLLLARSARQTAPWRVVAGSLLAFGVLDLMIWNGPGVATQETLYVVLFAAIGVPGMAFSTGLTAFVGSITPGRFRGRIFSAYLTVSDGFQALGMLLAGLLAGPIGLLPVLDAQAVLYLFAGLLAVRALTRTTRLGCP